jgi:hypothetical protein
MASIIKVDRILDSTEVGAVDIPGGVETTQLVADTWKSQDGTENYKCKAFVNFDGTTTPPNIRASGNVSSVARIGVGRYEINFANDMEDTLYTVVSSHNSTDGSNFSYGTYMVKSFRYTTSKCRVVTQQSGANAYYNFSEVYIAIFR